MTSASIALSKALALAALAGLMVTPHPAGDRLVSGRRQRGQVARALPAGEAALEVMASRGRNRASSALLAHGVETHAWLAGRC